MGRSKISLFIAAVALLLLNIALGTFSQALGSARVFS
jgi:uncharacterized protein YoxC